MRFDAALNNMSQGLAMFDAEHRLIVCNGQYADIFGLPRELMVPGTTLREILEHRIARGNHPDMDPKVYIAERIEKARSGKASRTLHKMTDGRFVVTEHRPMVGGGYVATFEDITERKRSEEKIAHISRHDALTDLPNRLFFGERMGKILQRLRRTGEQAAVFCLDLDHFKRVNDTLGHSIGDALLRAVTGRMLKVLAPSDVVARLGGDEFVILQVGADQPGSAGALARRLVEAVGLPYIIEGHQVDIGLSVGIAVAPGDGCDTDQLLKNAEMALYRAKGDGRGTFRFFEPEMDARAQARRALELDLRRALALKQFELHYQPLIDLASDRVSGCEALLRWHDPERGAVSPAEFIPIAEEIGLIAPLGEWVLRRGCAEAAMWPGDVKVAINLSPVQFKRGRLVEVVMSALASSGLPAHRLELEITESVLLEENEANLATLHQLRALGVRICLDDFGTGYSSLSYLRSFPFDKIKIDRSFVGAMIENAECTAIVRAIASLGASLGITTTAEGVETHEQLEQVRARGCTEVQGFLLSRPRPADEIASFILERAPGLAGVAAA